MPGIVLGVGTRRWVKMQLISRSSQRLRFGYDSSIATFFYYYLKTSEEKNLREFCYHQRIRKYLCFPLKAKLHAWLKATGSCKIRLDLLWLKRQLRLSFRAWFSEWDEMWVWFSTLFLTSCMTLGKLLNISKSHIVYRMKILMNLPQKVIVRIKF